MEVSMDDTIMGRKPATVLEHDRILWLLIEKMGGKSYQDSLKFAKELKKVQDSLSGEEILHMISAQYGKRPEDVSVDFNSLILV